MGEDDGVRGVRDLLYRDCSCFVPKGCYNLAAA
jgi:hypothetical protein